jgi:hypothetical protein
MIAPLMGDAHVLEDQPHETAHKWGAWIIELPEHIPLVLEGPGSAMVEISTQ